MISAVYFLDQEGANKKLLKDQEGAISSFEKEEITFRSCDTCFSQGSLAKDSYHHRRTQCILHAEWIKSVGESAEIVSFRLQEDFSGNQTFS